MGEQSALERVRSNAAGGGRRFSDREITESIVSRLTRAAGRLKVPDPLASLSTGRIAGFYRKHLKRFRLTRWVAQMLWQGLQSGYHRIRRAYVERYGAREQLTSLSSHITRTRAARKAIVTVENVERSEPDVYPRSARRLFRRLGHDKVFPGVFMTRISSGIVTGATNLLVTDHGLVHHDLYDFRYDWTSEELSGLLHIIPKNAQAVFLKKVEVQGKLPKAAVFTDACSGNYAHWLTEVLPRVNLYRSHARDSNVPLIVDDGLHPNIVQSLHLIAGGDSEFVSLRRHSSLYIKELTVVSPTGYVSFQRRPSAGRGGTQGIFSSIALVSMVKRLERVLGKEDGETPRRIFVRRNSGSRLLKNASDIEDTLRNEGFHVLEPERLTFAEQFRLFRNAEVVVGATGAAMANLLFCRPSTRIVVMMARHPDMPYWYWHNMAAAVGNRVSYVLGSASGLAAYGIHGNYRVDKDDVLAAACGS